MRITFCLQLCCVRKSLYVFNREPEQSQSFPSQWDVQFLMHTTIKNVQKSTNFKINCPIVFVTATIQAIGATATEEKLRLCSGGAVV